MIDDVLRPLGPGPRPPADGFVAALRAGRRRRLRTLRTNAACAATAAAAVLTAVVPRMATMSVTGLEPTRPVMTREATPPLPGGTAAPTTPAPTPRPPVYPGPGQVPPDAVPGYVPVAADADGVAPPRSTVPAYGGGAPAGGAGPTAGPTARPTRQAPADPAPRPEPTEPPRSSEPAPSPSPEPADPESPAPSRDPDPEPVDLSYENQPVNAPCETTAWCMSAAVDKYGDGSYVFRLRACRPASETTGRIGFRREIEADFRVVRGGTEVWRWSPGQPDDTYDHEVYVDRWQCAVWSTRWWGMDAGGDRVAAGGYRLDAMSVASTLPSTWWGTTFSVA